MGLLECIQYETAKSSDHSTFRDIKKIQSPQTMSTIVMAIRLRLSPSCRLLMMQLVAFVFLHYRMALFGITVQATYGVFEHFDGRLLDKGWVKKHGQD